MNVRNTSRGWKLSLCNLGKFERALGLYLYIHFYLFLISYILFMDCYWKKLFITHVPEHRIEYSSLHQNPIGIIFIFAHIHKQISRYTPYNIGYFVHIETDKLYKIKNCTDSDKTNAELYKRFSKDFISNVKKGTDQMIMCCGLEVCVYVIWGKCADGDFDWV